MGKRWEGAGNPWMVIVPLSIITILLAGGILKSIDWAEFSAHPATVKQLFENPRNWSDGLTLKIEGFVEPWVYEHTSVHRQHAYDFYGSKLHNLNDPRVRIVSRVCIPLDKKVLIIGKLRYHKAGDFLEVIKYYE